jgi:hypothetical protein
MGNDIDEVVRDLARTRAELAAVQEKMKNMKEGFEGTDEYKDASATIAANKTLAASLEETIRKAAVDYFRAMADKHLHGSVTVKEVEEVTVHDEEGLREWCLKNYTPALVLDMGMIGKAVLTGGIPAKFASAEKKPVAYIAKDLSLFA